MSNKELSPGERERLSKLSGGNAKLRDEILTKVHYWRDDYLAALLIADMYRKHDFEEEFIKEFQLAREKGLTEKKWSEASRDFKDWLQSSLEIKFHVGNEATLTVPLYLLPSRLNIKDRRFAWTYDDVWKAIWPFVRINVNLESYGLI